MASKRDNELAYQAGRAVLSEPVERRTVEACPFSPIEHSDERAAWLDGFADALDEDTHDPAAIRKAIKAARDA